MGTSQARPVIWVVDDSHLDAERARRVLAESYVVSVFEDGSAALEALSSAPEPDVIVLDWVMPGVTGLEVCRFLRSGTAEMQAIGVLLLTAHRHTEQIVEGLSAGANDYLAKPYADEELTARVAALLRTRELLDRTERAEAQYRRLLETTPDPLLVMSGTGDLSFVNEEAAVAFGRPAPELLSMNLAQLLPELAALLLGGPDKATLPPLPDVSVGDRLYSPSLNVLAQDQKGLSTLLLRDVTERRLLDARRLDFYSIIAHDLRTPLNAMLLRTHLLRNDQEVGAIPKFAAGMAKMEGNLNSLVAMINDFLELASLEGASYRLKRDQVDLTALIVEVVEELRPLLEASRHSFELIPCETGSEAVVLGDGRRLGQVVSNLLANAIKFTPAGGHVTARVTVAPAHAHVEVRDNGPGLDPSVSAGLFQRYKRAENVVGGTGLGLLIVREIIEAHGGVVGVDSAPGAGASFWFRVPRRTSRPDSVLAAGTSND